MEWTGLLLLVCLVAGAAVAVAPVVDGRSFGGFLAHRFVCAVGAECRDGEVALARAYGAADAALVREHAPGLVYEPGERQLPVDYLRCRSPACASAPDDRDLDAHRTDAGERATVFTRLLRRGGSTYLQYWLYYPDSNTAWAGSDKIWERNRLLPLLGQVLRGTRDYPGFHADDWEGYQLRIGPDGRPWARASSHRHYQGCKQSICRNRWVRAGGWTRVSRGSHAGHIPGRLSAPHRSRLRFRPALPGVDLRERTSTGEGLRLIPLESRDPRGYRPRDDSVTPPWLKEVYLEPESGKS